MNTAPKELGEKAEIKKFYNGRKHNLCYEWFEKENEKFKKYGYHLEYQKVPCGDCAGCQEAYSKDWATRCVLEAQKYKSNYFITLTYDEENAPRDDELVNKKTGEIFENDNWEQAHLEERDMTLFLKKLRITWKRHYNWPKDKPENYYEEDVSKQFLELQEGIRFFYCGEYGGQTQRPHYHMILFNFPIPLEELTIRKIDKEGNYHWECEKICNLWGKGHIDICEVNWDTCAYVARYVMKKQGGKKPDEYYYENGKTPEFIRMSRMPGLGLDFFTKNFQKIYQNDEIILKGHREKIQPVKPPRYFDAKYDLINHKDLEAIKEQRKFIAKQANKSKNLQTDLCERERLKREEYLKNKTWNSLKRDKV